MIDLGEIEFGIMSELIRQQITHPFCSKSKVDSPQTQVILLKE